MATPTHLKLALALVAKSESMKIWPPCLFIGGRLLVAASAQLGI